MSNAIEIKNVSKSYGNTIALKDVSLSVEQGEIFGLIGPDGAGKTSLIRILVTLLLPDSGKATLSGFDVVNEYEKIRSSVGYMPGKFSLYQDLTIEENMQLYATIFGTTIEENYDLVKDIYSQIEPFKKRRAGKLSGGMKQKLALSCSLIHKPLVLILDEPTTGVDPVSRKELWEMLKKLKKEGITVFVSTPYMDEASLCDRIALIQSGEILAIDTPSNMVESFNKTLLSINSNDKYKLLNDIRQYEFCNSIFPFGETLHYTDLRDDYEIPEIYEYLKNCGHSNIEIESIKASIEDCFMSLMAGGQDEQAK